ncbi:uncharacterized protein LOC113236389 [Hyposmocoma kahamanoa]|uniref:uncharacterized protein LOC113236389 n=1 Tax=Hyposmocoma kahamanoa TaxID=1477025 RepID=UPI000E6D9035|nr:uncharacterized protein LOC113236389 [Hyposmocoma kahamanoa]
MAEEKLIKKRGGIKSKLTIFTKYIAVLQSGEKPSSLQLLDLESRFNKFNALYAEYDKLQCEIETLSDSADDQLAEREEFECHYHALVAAARSLLGAQPAQHRERLDGSVSSFEDAQPQVPDTNINRIERFRRIELLKQHFWKRFSLEYVTLLQEKTKWRTSTKELKLNSLVLVKEKALPPLLWSLGRVTQLYPGSDGVTRVAELKTKRGTIRRAFNNICPLPVL